MVPAPGKLSNLSSPVEIPLFHFHYWLLPDTMTISVSKKQTVLQKKGLKIQAHPFVDKINISFGDEIQEELQRYDNVIFGDLPPNYKIANATVSMPGKV
ncbi:MAG: hypothetical protein EON98_04710 [Chitinophagaceae bacterium]|nr:MAG: hypothetical protein EON98_04710 [Chitinophagaceae bacterium]